MKQKTLYYCTECGNETPKWEGRCRSCGAWNSIVEQPRTPSPRPATATAARSRVPVRLIELDRGEEIRFSTGMPELDRVLGGGAVRGSLVLFGGAPGIGKSTLLLQICQQLCQTDSVLYVTGEESEKQIRMRADRLGITAERLYVLAETSADDILLAAEVSKPDILIVDSIQTMYSDDAASAAGSVAQVKACTMKFMRYGKETGCTVFLIGHVNKDGVIAGPKVLEHMVDCVLYFEGEKTMNYRILRAAKNRFGSTNEIGVFEMLEDGLHGISNPSALLLAERPVNAPGTCVTCVMEGSRPILAEVQGLAASASGNPRRTVNGFDYARANMMIAILDKRTAYKVSANDVFINVIGGLTIEDPGADLAMILCVASGMNGKPIPADLLAIGEVGLTGEIRSASHLDQRLKEAEKLGFKRCIVPRANMKKLRTDGKIELIPASNLFDALKCVFS